MSKFLSELCARQINGVSEAGRGMWRLTRPLIYKSSLTGETYFVPIGFETDFASVPRVPIAFLLCGDTASRPACLHDYFYSLNPYGKHPVPDRATADLLLKEAAMVEGVPDWRIWALYLGVRIGGASHWE